MKVLIFFLLTTSCVQAAVKPDKCWLDQKFSMFIHWGLYSELGGMWAGKPVTSGYSEQIQAHGGIFGDWYAAVAGRFLPGCWNADTVVALAKKAGMKSVVFTSKHHDGFCMYHSKYTDYNIVDATPFGRDVMKELAEACRRQGMRFGVYFSLIDWHFPQAYPISSHNADPLTPEHYEYNRKQVEEILTGYGPVSEIWFDMGSLTLQQSRGLYRLVDSLQPGCMISGRLGNDCSDFSVMADNEYPEEKIGVPWQTAASFFDETWGYRSWQKRGDPRVKTAEKIKSLVKVVSRGGNYLLNIGPKGDGSIVSFEREVLEKIGKWLEKYGEGIYGTQRNPFDRLYPGQEITLKGDCMYIFTDSLPDLQSIRLDGLRGNILAASYVGGGEIRFGRENGEWHLYGKNDRQPESPFTVICLQLARGWKIEPLLSPGKKHNLLVPAEAVPLYAYSSIDYYTGFRSMIAYTWGFEEAAPKIRPVVFYTDNEKGKDICMRVDGKEKRIRLEGGRKVKPASLLAGEKVKPGKTWIKNSGSVFGSRPLSGKKVYPGEEGSGWEEWTGFRWGAIQERKARERSSVLLLQELEAEKAGDWMVEVGSGNGIQVILNGEYISVHTSPRGQVYNRETVLLPLKKGKNQLLLKLYNRFEKKLCFSLDTCENAFIYRLEAGEYLLKPEKRHRCEVHLWHPEVPNRAMRLNNLRIKW